MPVQGSVGQFQGALAAPFIHLPSPMEFRLAGLLLSPLVQAIDLRYGHVAIMPAGYRLVAEALFQHRIRIEVNPDELAKHKLKGGSPLGMYDGKTNRIVVPRHNMFESEEGVTTLFHEATHAIQDRQPMVISSVQAEGATQVAEVWFLLETGFSTAKKNSIVMEVGSAMHGRRVSEKPVVATNNEVFRMNFAVMTVGGIADGASVGDGF